MVAVGFLYLNGPLPYENILHKSTHLYLSLILINVFEIVYFSKKYKLHIYVYGLHNNI